MAISPSQVLAIGLLYFAANTSFLAGLGYFTIWRPMVNGLLVGIIMGDPVRGATVGALINVLYLGYMSVGGTLGIGDAALAGILGATAGITSGIGDATQATGLGVLAGVVAGNAGFPLLSLRMTLDNRIVHRMDCAAERGDTHALVWLNIIPAQALLLVITALPVAVLATTIPLVMKLIVSVTPLWILNGLGLAGTGMAGALGIALAMKFVFKGRGVIVFLLGFALIAVTEVNIAIFVLAGLVILVTSDLVKLGRLRLTAGFGRNRATGTFLLWQFFSHSSYSFDRLQGSGVAGAFAPAIRRLYPAGASRIAGLKRHLTFFNVEPNWGSVIIGAILKMEEQHAAGEIDVEAITATKQTLMGTVSGFGDTISQGAVLPLVLSIGLSIGLSMSDFQWLITGVITYLALICPVILAISAVCFYAGYAQGRDAVIAILGNTRLKWWIRIAELVGAFMLGVLAAMRAVTGLHLANMALTQPIVDTLLRLGLVLLFFLLVNRLNVKPTLVLAGATAFSVALAFIGAL